MSENSTNSYYKSYPFTCNLEFDTALEITKYIFQLIYLVPGAIFIAYMLYVLTVKHRKLYADNYFFRIFVFELITSLFLIIQDIFFGRLTMYITPLCPILAPYFYDYSFLLKFQMVSLNYVRASKSVSQIFLTLNRMTCVLFPISHQKHWRKCINLVIFLNFSLPFGAIWSLILSRVYASATYGGFSSNYIRAIDWASLSRFQSIYLTISLIATIFFTILTFYGLQNLVTRVKTLEKMLCIATFFITFAFILVAISQYIWVFCSICSKTYPSLYMIQFLTYDFLNVGAPIVMVIINKQLRAHMFPWLKIAGSEQITVCNLQQYDTALEISKYICQLIYLVPGAIFIAYMLYVLTFKYWRFYADNYYIRIFVFELITSLFLIIQDIFFGRLTMYIPPLCPILGPYFKQNPSLLKFQMVSLNYVRASKSVSQFFLTLNRMTCVIFPITHISYWSKYINLVIILNIFLPFGAIWILIISEVYPNPTYGGFSSNYNRAIDWATISRFQSLYLVISMFFTIIFTILTFYGLRKLAKRVHYLEKILCIVTFFITFGFIFVACFQFVWVFCYTCQYNIPSLYMIQFLTYDFLNVGTPIVMVTINKQLLSHMFPWLKTAGSVQVTAISMAQSQF
ncbi:unnamed protein product [Caenorhabditis angaria]|uniref:Serpentine receptor class gamma n=1 Tax=Caenorhabditis angaria TaxID=860376 RepID=A0A9P1IFV8_9PELO|nr:unnamed protein product [Caenorhabditis angaria]